MVDKSWLVPEFQSRPGLAQGWKFGKPRSANESRLPRIKLRSSLVFRGVWVRPRMILTVSIRKKIEETLAAFYDLSQADGIFDRPEKIS